MPSPKYVVPSRQPVGATAGVEHSVQSSVKAPAQNQVHKKDVIWAFFLEI